MSRAAAIRLDATSGFVAGFLCDEFTLESSTRPSKREPVVRLIAAPATHKRAVFVNFHPELEIPLLCLHMAMQFDPHDDDPRIQNAAAFYMTRLGTWTDAPIPYLDEKTAVRAMTFLREAHRNIIAGEPYAFPYRRHTMAVQVQNFLLDTSHDIEAYHYRVYLGLGETSVGYMQQLRRRAGTVSALAKQIARELLTVLPTTTPKAWQTEKLRRARLQRRQRTIAAAGGNVTPLHARKR